MTTKRTYRPVLAFLTLAPFQVTATDDGTAGDAANADAGLANETRELGEDVATSMMSLEFQDHAPGTTYDVREMVLYVKAPKDTPFETIERVVRAAYGRRVARLGRNTHDGRIDDWRVLGDGADRIIEGVISADITERFADGERMTTSRLREDAIVEAYRQVETQNSRYLLGEARGSA